MSFLMALLILIALFSLSENGDHPKRKRSRRHILYTESDSCLEECCKRAHSIGIKIVKELPFIGGVVCETAELFRGSRFGRFLGWRP